MRNILVIVLLFVQLTAINAQIEACFFTEHHTNLVNNDSSYHVQTQAFNKQINRVQNQSARTVEEDILTVPVVIHIMHLPEDSIIGSGSNLSDEAINNGITYLNEAYSNINSYSGGPYYSNAGVNSDDVKIDFCLAKQDINGVSSTGIYRTSTTLSNLNANEGTSHNPSLTQERYLQSLSVQPSDACLNIWLVNNICAYEGVSCGISGFAYFPSSHGAAHDGVIMKGSFWGNNEQDAKVQIHEVGHYLGLYHTFQGSCSETDCQTGGDRVCDTPPDSSTGAVCGDNSNSCSNDDGISNSPFTSDVEDIYENYMDYGSISCQNTFTPGQKERMRIALQTQRSSLLSSVFCQEVSSGVLPIEGIELAGEPRQSGIYLSWEIAGEEDNPIFILETSADGVVFSPVHHTGDFSHFYKQVSNGLSYYRIKYTNQDGRHLYSNVIAINFNESKEALIYPNPVNQNEIFVTLKQPTNEIINWQLFDLNGKEYQLINSYSVNASLGEMGITLPTIPNGVYYLRSTGNFVTPLRFIKI